MSKTAKIIVVGIVLVAMAIAAVIVGTSSSDETKNKNPETSPQAPVAPKPKGDKAVAVTAVITYTNKGFDPKTIAIKANDAITVTNQSHNRLSFESASSSNYASDPELNVGDIKPGESKTFVLMNKGRWGFHNKLNSSQHGIIRVR